jgi:DNA-binding NarL/FixJ family response regulator
LVGRHAQAIGVMTAVRERPTRRDLEVLHTYNAAGSIATAAHDLSITENTIRQYFSGLYRRIGYVGGSAWYPSGWGR